MTPAAYYNEFDPYAAQWLRNLIAAGHIAPGDVDERSITDVAPDDLAGYRQCHFFAGIAGWSLAARLAGWPDDRELWTGSAPCQPFSVAGAQRGTDDDRHLWPHFFRLIRARRPAVVMGEQVAAAVGAHWLDGVCADLEGVGYACGAAVVPACAVDGPHRRDRLWFVGEHRGRTLDHGERAGLERLAGHGDAAGGRPEPDRPAAATCRGSDVGDADQPCASEGREQRSGQLGGAGGDPRACGGGDVADSHGIACGQGRALDGGRDQRSSAQPWAGLGSSGSGSAWGNHAWIIGHDGKARRVEPDFRRVVDGLSESLGRLCADFYAEAAEGVIGYATATQRGPDEVLRAVRDTVAAQAVWQEPRGFHGIREAEVLLPFLRELERRLNEGWAPGAIAEAAGQGVRGVRIPARVARAPQRRGLHEQRAEQYPDTLYALSWVLARAARQALEALLGDAPLVPLLTSGAAARVGRLRAYGNAIVPQVAAEVIAAFMECRP